MAKVTMSLYEALTRKKTYESRLKDMSLASKPLFGYYTESNKVINGCTLEEAEKVMKSNFDSYIHIQSNIQRLQIAINEANLGHTIVIPGYNNDQPVTLVQAITEKQKLPERNAFVNTVARKLNDCMAYIDQHNQKVLDPKNVYDQVAKTGTSDKKSEDTADILSRKIEAFKKDNTCILFDPNRLVEKQWIEKQRAEIDSFAANLHTALTKANTEIIIEVELED